MILTDAFCNEVEVGEGGKPAKYSDAGGLGLHLLVMRSGKYWRMNYRFEGQYKTLALGVHPAMSLEGARALCRDARAQLKRGVDPGVLRKIQKTPAEVLPQDTFEAVGREWLAKQMPTWVPSHGDRIVRRLERDVFPWLGSQDIASITPPELLKVLMRIEQRGVRETCHRALGNCRLIFRYAIATGRMQHNPADGLTDALAPVVKGAFATMTDPEGIARLLRDMDAYEGTTITRCALHMAPLVFVRPGELRKAEWCEFDFDKRLWQIPAGRMKLRRPHLVPLSRQVLCILDELKVHTGQGTYLFPSIRTASRPMSENTINSALRRLGYGTDDITGHGFRHMASTLLNEQGWNPDAIERQLAHVDSNTVRGTYNKALYLPERVKMMQAWADYLDELKRK